MTEQMTNEQAREMFDKAIANTEDAGKATEIQLLREYFTSEEFRSKLHDYVWEVNQAQS